ncbi:MAG: phage major tail tube protein [Rhodobacter sp.]|nr:phage major tail tube protein [Rhodobacter sp.]
MAYPRKVKNYNAFLDGVSYFGKVDEATLPVPKLSTEDHRGAGMDAPVAIDMGMEAMTASITLAEWPAEVLTKLGTRQQLVLRPAAMGETDFSADTYIATMRGRITTAHPETLKTGGDNPMKLDMAVDFYRLEKDGEELLEIDIENAVRTIGGVDQLADIRRAMGI